jgi:hypothetical protein
MIKQLESGEYRLNSRKPNPKVFGQPQTRFI